MVNTETMTGTGQLPKFKDQAYHVDNQTEGDFWLIPTAEVPVTNYYRGEIINEELPVRFCAYSSCLELRPVRQDVILVVSFVSINSKG